MKCFNSVARHVKDYDVIVCGGGVAGVAAAFSASKMGKSVLIVEKSCAFGGLATTGLINMFVPMCNGRGRQIIYGLCETMLRESIKYGYDSLPSDWREPNILKRDTTSRYVTHYSAPIFSLVLTEMLKNENVDIIFDGIVQQTEMDKGTTKGVYVYTKEGFLFYGCKVLIDTTGDADVLHISGVPTIEGKNYYTYIAHGVSKESMQKAIDTNDLSKAILWKKGGGATLFGKNHPSERKLYSAIKNEDLNEYLVDNQLELLKNIKNDDRNSRTLTSLPYMPQFRTSRRIDGDYTMTLEDENKHFDDSIGAICDFERRDYLYEMPYRTLIKSGFNNILTAGRSTSASGYMWDVVRVIPPAIISGQAAGIAAVHSIEQKVPVANIDISLLQEKLAKENVVIHFDDNWQLDKENSPVFKEKDITHLHI